MARFQQLNLFAWCVRLSQLLASVEHTKNLHISRIMSYHIYCFRRCNSRQLTHGYDK